MNCTTNNKKVIHLINGRCGGNKTGYIVSQIQARLAENPQQCIIYSAPTKKVLNEVYSNRLTELDETQKLMIVSEDVETVQWTPTVKERAMAELKQNYCGCLMITHMTLFNIVPELLQDKLVIIDESPEQTVKFSHKDFDTDNPPAELSKLIELTQAISSKASNSEILIPNDKEAEKALFNQGKQFIGKAMDIQRSGWIDSNNQHYNNIASLYLAAASKHGFVYHSRVATDNGTKSVYRSIELGDMLGVVSNASAVWIASADFEHGLLCFLLQQYHQISIEKIEGTGIPIVHEKENVTILSLLGDDKLWSKTFSDADRNKLDGFNFDHLENYTYQKSVFEELYDFGVHCILDEIYTNESDEHEKALMFLNVAKQNSYGHEDFIQVSTQSHGQNSYQMHNHAIWMASLVPNPDQFYVLRWFCEDHNIDPQEAQDRFRHTRQYAPLYQGLARTSLRVER
ncbi:hypothetical protein [Shewanella subflava]|uniref:Uncharacterized protein n=1 Tax=Shewanella subflava TaxID=2986476 RepID=A0ABT3I9C5_9GAMM|nr:hypothetical protein [Shewanella subflava]MCW3172448.1 hypothetical protein [Shewanella subflava]